MSRLVHFSANAGRGGATSRDLRQLDRHDWRFVALVTLVSVLASVGLTILAGARTWDYLWPAFAIPFMVAGPASTYLRLQHALITRLNAQLHELLRRDPLTGLLTRRAFLAEAGAAAESKGGALFLIDVDHFKRINDTWGHPAGDAVLTEVCNRLGVTSGNRGICGRLGGEEFAVLLPEATEPAALLMGEALRAVIATRPVAVGAALIEVTISLGQAMVGAGGGGLALALPPADAALYRAKRAGRNCLVAAAASHPDALRRAVGAQP